MTRGFYLCCKHCPAQHGARHYSPCMECQFMVPDYTERKRRDTTYGEKGKPFFLLRGSVPKLRVYEIDLLETLAEAGQTDIVSLGRLVSDLLEEYGL